ncbi:3-deoxy-manno-octulosonate cytidylyltransferase [Orrella daihaiensis]|uniref:3-deoxy-manno-octulosonate cytidylyltransferase n=1 Tax=Orrella daihaiensis TaxID=2782176 RepID=A0ABY4AG30_9BURK|nr:3-deoxy-manno-octulosonate cytidylyltransferase [Orrella daihaiensis]UOD49244.1 3-deoxy-manno-octulosonate cytidylyltransferase [Orrella daihaiensis]
MDYHVVIPARWASTRLPGKMLADLAGKPMVVRTAERARLSDAQSVTIATDYEPIAQAAREHGLHAVMTRGDHQSGTDRLSETVQLMQWPDSAIVVNVQGDEPRIDPALIGELAQCLAKNPEAAIATAAARMTDQANVANPNAVKVVLDQKSQALYFSRAAIPFMRTPVTGLSALHHIGIYAYRVRFLKIFPGLTQGLLERAESLEQLRALEHGWKIQVLVTEREHAPGVDTEQDLLQARQFYASTI